MFDGRGVDARVPRVVDRLGQLGDRREVPFAPGLSSPMIDELVTRDADQPRHRHVVHLFAIDGIARGEEGLRGEILREREIATARLQVPVDLR